MDKQKTKYFVHIGAPRTGTSYLRKHVFPNIGNVRFYNKLEKGEYFSDFLAQLAHAGDGDEIAGLSLLESARLPSHEGKVLISEEHFLWSVYHMFGNVGSRARLLKQCFPDAKIILTIRRQPEYFVSIFRYLQTLNTTHLGRQLHRIDNMLDIDDEIVANVYKFYGIPCGIEWEKKYKVREPGADYFNRLWRHFMSVNISWLRIAEIYSELFGRENIFVLPQEMLRDDPKFAIDKLANFFEEKIQIPLSALESRENTTKKIGSPFKNKLKERQFQKIVMTANFKENKRLCISMPHLHLEHYGYCEKVNNLREKHKYGFVTKSRASVSKRRTQRWSFLMMDSRRSGYFRASNRLITSIFSKLKKIIKNHVRVWSKRIYLYYSTVIDHWRGLDFEGVITLDALGLDSKVSCQYESSKKNEIQKTLRQLKIETETTAIDFGCGKGRVIVELARDKRIKVIYGIEISSELVKVAKKNIEKLGLSNIEIIERDAREVPASVLDSATLIYFYNPFPEAVMVQVVRAIDDSLSRNLRKLNIVYFNPIAHSAILKSKYMKFEGVIENRFSNAPTYLYSSEKAFFEIIPGGKAYE